MLDWFGRKLREVREVKRDERGFTLIELLVVIIIIAILAAIAIPTFLAQRENAQQAQIVSDLRNAVTAAQSFAVENDGDYTGLNRQALLDNGAEESGTNAISAAGPNGADVNNFTITVTGPDSQTATFNSAADPQLTNSWTTP